MSTSLFATRHRLIVIGAAATLTGGMFVATNIATAASGPSAVDYAQCTNGAPNTTPPAGCNSWINGVLNANNSQYHEDQVTPQRLTVAVTDPAAATDPVTPHTHSVTLTYLARKGGVHAYDYLATVNTTQGGAIDARCQGLPSIPGVCPTSATTVSGSEAITPDTTAVSPCTSSSDCTTALRESSDSLKIFGADFTSAPAMTVPQHDNATGTGDDYATTKISFTTYGSGVHNVQLLFGGHLAAGSQVHGWGTGLGAASINGGPYHIKWAAADGASVGNRDNQIMSGAILPIVPVNTSISTTPHPNTTDPTKYYDVATLGDVSPISPPAAGETVTFDLYGPFTQADPPSSTVNSGAGNCTDPVDGSGGNEFGTTTGSVVAGPPPTATSGYIDMTHALPGIYQWIARYPGDAYNNPIDGTCGDSAEQFTIKTSPTGTSAQTITDTVTLHGQYVPASGTLGGSVTFKAYTSNTCSDASLVFTSGGGDITDGIATSDGFTPSSADAAFAGGVNNYYWKVTYSGDDYNNASTLEDCAVEAVSVQDAPARPTP